MKRQALFNIPSSWEWTTMDHISTVIGGGTPKTKVHEYFEGGSISWLTPADLSGYTNKYISHGKRFITQKGLDNSSAKMMPSGAVLFTSRAPIGYVVIAKNPISTNQGFKSFVLKEGISPDYVYWWLKGNKNLAQSYASGTTFLELSGAKAKQLPIPIAPINEQKLIVSEIEKQFSRLDEAVAALKRIKVNLKRYKASVLKVAVEGKLTEQWRKEHTDVEPASALLKRICVERKKKWEEDNLGKKYKEPVALDISNLPELPKSWIWIRLEHATERITKGSSPKWQGFDYVIKGIPFVRSQNVIWGKMDLSKIAHLPKEFNEKESKSILIKGDVLLNIVGASIGRSAIATKEVEGGNVNQAVAVIRLMDMGLNNTFLMNYLISADAQDRINKEKVDVARANLSLGDISNLIVPLPPEEEQSQIINEMEKWLSITDQFLSEVETNLERAERLRQSILKKAFSGKLTK